MMQVNYTYSKYRRDFGKQCRFSDYGPSVLACVKPDARLDTQWIQKNPINKSTNYALMWSDHEVNTVRLHYMDRGIRHKEGGWPGDENPDDPEQVVRFRKKMEKEESYLQAAMKMSNVAEHFLNQNNAIDIYQPYFTDPSCQQKPTLTPSLRTMTVMPDPCNPNRPVQNISWSQDQEKMIAVSYADMGFQTANPKDSPNSYIFTMEYNTPYFTIESPYPIVTLEFNHRDPKCLAGGLMSGQVAYWDIRKSSENVAISNLRYGHRDPVNSLCWVHSKTNTEFYTGSIDGQVMWWDIRKLREPTEVLILDLSKNENTDQPEWSRSARTHGVSCMDYDFSIPIRFMIGTETGLVFNGNRKGKTVFEKIAATHYCHQGPVYSTQRNPVFTKNFLTVSDWQVRVWSEDVKDSPIMWTKPHDVRLTDGVWSESKPSVFYTTRADGCLECWDLLQKQNDPILIVKVADEELNCLRCHEDGALLAIGDKCGNTYVMKMNEWFVIPGKNERALLTTMIDRETRREKIIEAKQRELKLKTTLSTKAKTSTKEEKLNETKALMIAEMEKEFGKLIATINEQPMYDNENLLENREEEATANEDQTIDQ